MVGLQQRNVACLGGRKHARERFGVDGADRELHGEPSTREPRHEIDGVASNAIRQRGVRDGETHGDVLAREVQLAVDGTEAPEFHVEGEGRVLALLMTVDGHEGAGLILVYDLEAGVLRFEEWAGTVVEYRPGTIIGIDPAGQTHWIALDRPLSG